MTISITPWFWWQHSNSGYMILMMAECLFETKAHIYQIIRRQYASVFLVTTIGVSDIFSKLSGHVHYFKTFCFVAEILSSLCNEFLKANVSAILYLMNYEKYGRSTASAQYFLQLAGYLGIPVIAWNADNSGLERVRCECWLYFKTICSFCLFGGSSLVPDTGWAKSRYTVIIFS